MRVGVREGVIVWVMVGIRVGVRVAVEEGVDVLIAGSRVFVEVAKGTLFCE